MPISNVSVKPKGKALITGIAGFAGSHLAELLLSEGYSVYGIIAPKERTPNIGHIKKQVKTEQFDLLRAERAARFIKAVKPDHIYHLAAFASVGESFANERLTYEVNFTGTLNLLRAIMKASYQCKRFLFVSSADTYGLIKPKNRTLTEEDPLNPISPYGVSKAAAESLIEYYEYHHGLPANRIRAFNHTGPRQSDTYVIPSFCRQIAEIEAGLKKPEIMVGNLSPKRDFSDVRDIVRGYYLAVSKGKAGEVYQFCSGRAVSIRTILNSLLKLSSKKIKVTVDKNRFRKSDIPVLRGNNRKAVKELGWVCRYKLDETLRDTLDFWRAKIRKNS